MKVDVIVVGAGAAGCFSAISAASHFPGARIIILEKSQKVLAKVKISGGGRCNVTNVVSDPAELSRNYPRGERFLKKCFHQFSSKDMKDWLEKKGVHLKLYPDGCYFPQSNDSQTIIDLFLSELKRLNVPIYIGTGVTAIQKQTEGWTVQTSKGDFQARSVIVTTGGSPKLSGFDFLDQLDLKIVPPVPSLFTFNLPDHPICKLMGIVTEATVKLSGDKQAYSGPLLITHWGMSGPAILKASAFGARKLAESGYEHDFMVNWVNGTPLNEIRSVVEAQLTSGKKMSNACPFEIRSRLWEYLLERAGIGIDDRWNELAGKRFNKLLEVLSADVYRMKGKTTFKEEFVTAGGIDLTDIQPTTLEHKRYSGLFFAGEVLDIDGITGGFNFQGAWTTGFIAGKSVLLEKPAS